MCFTCVNLGGDTGQVNAARGAYRRRALRSFGFAPF